MLPHQSSRTRSSRGKELNDTCRRPGSHGDRVVSLMSSSHVTVNASSMSGNPCLLFMTERRPTDIHHRLSTWDVSYERRRSILTWSSRMDVGIVVLGCRIYQLWTGKARNLINSRCNLSMTRCTFACLLTRGGRRLTMMRR